MELVTYRGTQIAKQEAYALWKIEEQINEVPEFIIEDHQVVRLNLANASLHDLKLLTPLTHLQKLHLRYTAVDDLSPLTPLTNLQELHLGGTSVSDISPLRDLKQLRYLGLRYTYVSDVAPLKDLPLLELVDLVGTMVPKRDEKLNELRSKGVEVII